MQDVVEIGTGTSLAVEVTGSGEPLLLVQGMSGHGGMWGPELVADLARDFHYGVVDAVPEDVYLPRFGKVAYLIQMPRADLASEIAREKGAPLTPGDRAELERRAAEARAWLRAYAPDHYRFQVQETLPAADLTGAQRDFLARLAAVVAEREWRGDELHARIHDLRRESGLEAKEAFGAVYLAFLGKTSGPQAGWFLAAMDREFVVERLREASRPGAGG